MFSAIKRTTGLGIPKDPTTAPSETILSAKTYASLSWSVGSIRITRALVTMPNMAPPIRPRRPTHYRSVNGVSGTNHPRFPPLAEQGVHLSGLPSDDTTSTSFGECSTRLHSRHRRHRHLCQVVPGFLPRLYSPPLTCVRRFLARWG
jgi:hypothetical protein